MIGSGGELVGSYDWGTRRMAYEIDHRPEAEYRLYQFNGDNTLLERLNQRLRITDAVLRFRIIKVKPGQPTPPPPDQQAPRRRDDREPQDTKVAARAAADAPALDETRARCRCGRCAACRADAPAADVAVAERSARRGGRRRMPRRPWRHRPRRMPARRTRRLRNGLAKDPALFGNFLGRSARRLRTRMHSRSTSTA